jgi:6-phosphogluconolactonase
MAGGRTLAFVGTLNRPVAYFPAANGPGIGVFTYNEDSGAFTPLHQVGGVDNPAYLLLDAAGRTLYAASEVSGWHEGIVTAYRIDRASGALTYINKQATRGSITAHLSLHPSGHWLFVTNYRMGPDGARPPQAVVVFPVEADGGIGAPVASVAHSGHGPNARQEGPHPHCAVPSADGRHVVVADLGIDQLRVYRFDVGTGALAPATRPLVALPPGAGPRSLAFHPSGRFLFATYELGSAVAALAWDEASGGLDLIEATSTLPEGWTGASTCSDLALSPDGRFLYVANRGHDSIAVFAIDPASGRMHPLQHHPTSGATPRHITLDLTGRFLLVANQDGDAVVALVRDAASGTLSPSGQRAAIGTPMCVRLLRVD